MYSPILGSRRSQILGFRSLDYQIQEDTRLAILLVKYRSLSYLDYTPLGAQKSCSVYIPNISTTFTKKSSLVPTNTTTLNSKTKSNTFSTSEESSSKLKSSKLSFSDGLSSNARTSELESSRLESSTDVSVTTLSSSAKKETKGKKKKSKDSDKSVSEDSVFQSFAIDANADRLCMFVMEQIDEEIVDAGAEDRTEKV